MTDDDKLLASLIGFTPGPWDLGKRYDSVISSNITGFDDARTVDAYGGHLVCESAKMKQNAALIAAAPDLHRIATERATEIARLRAGLETIKSASKHYAKGDCDLSYAHQSTHNLAAATLEAGQ